MALYMLSRGFGAVTRTSVESSKSIGIILLPVLNLFTEFVHFLSQCHSGNFKNVKNVLLVLLLL